MADLSGMPNPVARNNGLVIHELPGEVLVYDLDTNRAHCLNESAALVWQSCDGTNSVRDIVKQFETCGGGKVDEDFVWLAIDQLNENGLLNNSVRSTFDRQARRQLLKTIGCTSIVALPMIASLVAPQRALGVSSCACTTDLDCSLPQCPNKLPHCNNLGLCDPRPRAPAKRKVG